MIDIAYLSFQKKNLVDYYLAQFNFLDSDILSNNELKINR